MNKRSWEFLSKLDDLFKEYGVSLISTDVFEYDSDINGFKLVDDNVVMFSSDQIGVITVNEYFPITKHNS